MQKSNTNTVRHQFLLGIFQMDRTFLSLDGFPSRDSDTQPSCSPSLPVLANWGASNCPPPGTPASTRYSRVHSTAHSTPHLNLQHSTALQHSSVYSTAHSTPHCRVSCRFQGSLYTVCIIEGPL